MSEVGFDPEEIRKLLRNKIEEETKKFREEEGYEEEKEEGEEETESEASMVVRVEESPPDNKKLVEVLKRIEEEAKREVKELPSPPPGDGGKVIATLGDYIRGKIRVPGFKQFVTVSVSPAVLLYHGIAVALNLVDKDVDLSSFVERCIVDWMRWHGVELVVRVYPGMDMFLALERKFGKDIDRFVSELLKG